MGNILRRGPREVDVSPDVCYGRVTFALSGDKETVFTFIEDLDGQIVCSGSLKRELFVELVDDFMDSIKSLSS